MSSSQERSEHRQPWLHGFGDLAPQLVELREDLHRHPELSFREHRTTEKLRDILRSLDIEILAEFEATGLAARIRGSGGGATIAVRGDIDALPIQEESGLEFSSEVAGVMHACGHDVHAAWAVGAAGLLKRSPAAGDVIVILQPAEETGLGARVVLDSGVLEGVSAIFGGHVDPRFEVGEAVASAGPCAAATDEFVIVVRGSGAHGARPHLGNDPVVAGAALVNELQSLVSRRVTPGDPAVVTVGEFHAGTAPNIIPEMARLSGTLRSVRSSTRQLLRSSVEQMAAGVARSFGTKIEVSFLGGTPPLINDPVASTLARRAVERILGADRLRQLPEPNMGGEDFAVYLEHLKGCFLRFGSRHPSDVIVGAHHPRFLARTESVFAGAAVLAEAARLASSELGAA